MDSGESKEEPAAPKQTSALAAAAVPATGETAKKTGNKKKRSNPSTATATGNKQDGQPSTKKKKKDTNAPAAKKKKKGSVHQTNVENMPLIEQVMYRLTEGIPRMELKSVISEADQCERELQHEIKILEAALKEEVGPLEVPKIAASKAGAEKDAGDAAKDTNADDKTKNNDKSGGDTDKKADGSTSKQAATNESGVSSNQETVDILAETPFTPLDKCFTLSALLGRLRDDLAIPSIRKPPPGLVAASSTGNTGKKKKGSSNTPAVNYPQLVALAQHPNYTRVHPEPAQLLHVWRKIAGHRTAMVFRKPVKPEEAPGYADRILFPMDLSLVRKMIVARILTSYSEVHQKIRLISHNCVKYNGRESDYGIVAREFEAAVDEFIVAAVNQTPQQAATAAAKGAKAAIAKAQSSKASGSGRISPKNVAGGSGRSSPKNAGGGSDRSSPKNAGAGSGRSSPAKNLPTASGAQEAPSAAAISAATSAAAAAIAPTPAPPPAKS